MNHEKFTLEEYSEYRNYKGRKNIIVFFIGGNHGAYEQFPIIANSLEKYLNSITEQQKNQDYDSLFAQMFPNLEQKVSAGKGTRVHMNLLAFGFDLHEQPQAVDM